MTNNWLAFPAGIFIASASTTVGIGGGILWMPFFLIILKIPSETAILTSLVIQTIGMGSGSITYLLKKKVDIPLACFLIASTIPGIALGVYLGTFFDANQLTILLGIITMTTAFLFVSATQKYENAGFNRLDLAKVKFQAPLVTLMSIASGLLSVSIGEWLVPLMRGRWSLKMSTSVATSITVIFGTCIVGVTFHLFVGHKVDQHIAIWAIPGVFFGGQIGPRIMAKVTERVLKEVFIFLLTLIGIHLIYNSY